MAALCVLTAVALLGVQRGEARTTHAHPSHAMWAGSGDYVYLRRQELFGSAIRSAVVEITALTDGDLQKLLGAYRLYVNGHIMGTGPGRGDCLLPAVDGGINDPSCSMLDTLDITKACVGWDNVTLAVQGYRHNSTGRVAARFSFTLNNGSVEVVETDARRWRAFDATAYHAPYTSVANQYIVPRENIVASAWPGNWTSPSFTPDSRWGAAVDVPVWPVVKKVTQALDLLWEVPAVEKINTSYIFFDFGHEVMAAMELDVVCEGYVQVTLGEELVAPHVVLYPMRTKNYYRYMWQCGGHARFAIHEYALFRYGSLRFCKEATLDACVEGTDVAALPHLDSFGGTVVRYPWNDADASFTSSDDMLNRIWQLCKNTMRDTSLDTMTDSNTRERRPYEADAFITGWTRFVMSNGSEWQQHTYAHMFRNPTWPTEWRQFTPLLALQYYMESKDTSLVEGAWAWEYLYNATYIGCVNHTTQLVDFTNCSRNGTTDIVDFPPPYRGGYVMTDVNTVVNCFTVAALRALATLGRAAGKPASLTTLMEEQAARTEAAIKTLLFDTAKGLFFDGLDGAQNHTGWHAQTNTLWLLNTSGIDLSQVQPFLREARIVGSVYGVVAYVMGFYKAFPEDQGHTMLEMLTQCDTNSWCHMLEVGATATSESWAWQQNPGMTYSHPWGTSAAGAIKHGIMGLTATSPGYDTWQLRPQSGNLTSGSATFPQTLHGPFHLSLKRSSTGEFSLHYTAPLTTEGEVCLPVQGSAGDYVLRMDGEAVDVAAVTLRDTYLCAQGPSGEHVFSLTRK